MTKRASTAIASTSYDPMTRTLGVTYSHGATYEYHGVPTHVNAAFERSESKGAFLVKHIKGKYKTVKVTDGSRSLMPKDGGEDMR